jgi:phage terminase large subunit GpA-like protein
MPEVDLERTGLPEWILDALKVFKPPSIRTVSEWADEYRILDSRSALPGPWKTHRTPYLRAVMDAVCDPDVEEVTFVKPTQVGGTEAILNVLGYLIAQDPSPALLVYPTEDLAKSMSKNRIKPMLRLIPEVAEKVNQAESETLEFQFPGMSVALAGANSPTGLSSRPVRVVFLDEMDKYPRYSGKEAAPAELAKERTKTFHNRKIFKTSTPTTKAGPIWMARESADELMEYFVPCPHCGKWQTLKFKRIKWPEEVRDPETARGAAWYECEECGGQIRDNQKMDMLRAGEWWATRSNGHRRSVAYQLNALYSPWTTFGDVAAEFLRSKDFPELLMNFVNSWLAEPWEPKASRFRSDVVLEHRGDYARGTVPRDALLLTLGADVQLDHFWYVVRAWGQGLTSWLVEEGRVETWDQLEEVLQREYNAEGDAPNLIQLALIDSGFRTEEVYQFCAELEGLAIPSKGANMRLTSPYRVSSVDKAAGGDLKIVIVDTHYYKDFLAGRLSKPLGEPGSWYVPQDVDREYADQICSEQKVSEKDGKGRLIEKWQKISSHSANHLLDAEVGAACAAEMSGVRYLKPPEPPPEPKPETKRPDPGRNNWIKRGNQPWIHR